MGEVKDIFLTRHIGMTTYTVRVHLSETANEMIEDKITMLYERLSRDDVAGDSNSILNKKQILLDYANAPCFLCRRRHFRDDFSKNRFLTDAENDGERSGRDDHRKGCLSLQVGTGRDWKKELHDPFHLGCSLRNDSKGSGVTRYISGYTIFSTFYCLISPWYSIGGFYSSIHAVSVWIKIKYKY